MKKVLITGDSTSDLSPELIDRYNIKTIPLGIVLDDKIYRDGIDVTPDDIYENYNKTGKLPKTNAVNIGDYTDFFKKYVDQGYAIVHFSLCSDMSSTYQNAVIAASELEDVYIVDTRNLSNGEALLMIKGYEYAESGMEAKEIFEKCTELTKHIDTSFVIDSLLYLYKGGRCSALSALGANVLKLKPLIEVRNGKMGVGKKYRGNFGTVLETYVKERLENIDDIELDHIFVTHAGIDNEIYERLVNIVKERAPFKHIYLSRAGCTISSHCGQNSMGILFIRKSEIN